MAKREWIIEASLFLAVVIFAAALRLWNLSFLPFGFHGDEAVSGLEAQRIWRENGIGPYTSAALGQPTGPIYWVALSIRIFGDTIFAVRLVSALSGTLSIVVLYFGARRHFGPKVAWLAAFLLTVTTWHLHYSRIGFPLAMWPLFVLLGAFLLLEAIERRHAAWWAFAGAILGCGIYIYNAHWLFLATACAYAAWRLWDDKRISWPQRLSFAGIFTLALLGSALPMLLYALKPQHSFSTHFALYSLFQQPEWVKAPSYGVRFSLVVGRYFDFWERLCWNPHLDFSDGSGIVSLMPLPLTLLAAAGIYRSWKRRHEKALSFFLLWVLVLPCAAVFTVEGTLRRTFALAPILALFAALGLVEIYRALMKRKPHLQRVVKVAIAGLLLVITAQALRDYFVRFLRSEHQSWVFLTEITQASHWMQQLSPDSHVYFFSERCSAHYQTRQFLAPRVWIEDRSKEYGSYSLDNRNGDRESIWMLLDKYQTSLDKIRTLHPGGQIIYGPPLPGTDKICFVAYRLKQPR